MKKTIAVLLTLALCLSMIPAAFAEEAADTVTQITWEEWEAIGEEKGLTGEFVYIIEDIGMKMWLVDTMSPVEITEEMSSKQGFIALYTDDSNDFAAVTIFQFEDENLDTDALAEMLQSKGIEELYFVEVNGIPAVLYRFFEDDIEHYVVSIALGNGIVTEISFTIADLFFADAASVMAASITIE